MWLNHRELRGQTKGPEASEALVNSLNSFFREKKSGVYEMLKACVDDYKILSLPAQCGQWAEFLSAT